MYTIQFHDYQITCDSADEVRELCNGSTYHSNVQRLPNIADRMDAVIEATAKPARRKARRKATDTRGKTMSERWEKARRYAKRHDVTPSEAFKILSK
jgi:predicted ATPase with chaperone activity